MIDSLNQSYETLKNGTDIETMRKITHRYITDIYIEPWEGKATFFWKKVTIKTIHDTDKEKKIENNSKSRDWMALFLPSRIRSTLIPSTRKHIGMKI